MTNTQMRQAPTYPPCWSPEFYLGVGIITYVAAAIVLLLCLASDQPDTGLALGGVFAFPASIWLTIGMVAKGVQVGNRRTR